MITFFLWNCILTATSCIHNIFKHVTGHRWNHVVFNVAYYMELIECGKYLCNELKLEVDHIINVYPKDDKS